MSDFFFGSGASYDLYGVPQPANFWGQSGWWTVPTSWNCRSENGQIWVSPSADFKPRYAAKTNVNGELVFMDEMANLHKTLGKQMHYPQVTYPGIEPNPPGLSEIDLGASVKVGGEGGESVGGEGGETIGGE